MDNAGNMWELKGYLNSWVGKNLVAIEILLGSKETWSRVSMIMEVNDIFWGALG